MLACLILGCNWHITLSGGDFLETFFKRPEDNKCYFATTCDGKPIKMQRTIFCECFYIMAMTGLYQATKEDKYKVSIYPSIC